MSQRPRTSSAFPSEPIAVIGVGCRFPKAADPEAFWQILHDGVDAISEVPKGRWDVDAYYDADLARPNTMSTRWGGFLERLDEFSPAFFGISPGEARSMDPQQRLLLEVSWEAIENAGQSPDQLAGSRTGVYVGISGSDYNQVAARAPDQIDAYWATGNALTFAANRISNFLDLRGPSMCLDTGCSASLFAVHLACQSLRLGEIDLALVGGVNALVSPAATVATSQAWIMSSDGRCKSFDASADGYVRSEGCGIAVLKRLSDALRDGDRVLGVLRSTAVNGDGRGSGLTNPNPTAQEEVIRRALADAGASPAQIDYIEAHGVGTKAADVAEAQVLSTVFGNARTDAQGCLVGSVKTNIGHLEAAAGIAALIKVLLALENEQIPRNLHFQELHPEIAGAGARIVIPTEPRAWPRSGDRPRMAGINSFGMGGANAHIIVEEPPVSSAAPAVRAEQLLTLSAKSAAALRALAGRYAEHLAVHPDEDLADICFTAHAGRAHFPFRLALATSSVGAAREALATFAAEGAAPGVRTSAITGAPQDEHAPLPAPLPEGAGWRALLDDLAERYLGGSTIDLAVFGPGGTRRKLALPTYPFERRRYWAFDEKPGEHAAGAVDERPASTRPRLQALLEDAPIARRREELAAFVETEVASVLGLESPARIDRTRGLFDLGMTSLMAVALKNRLQESVGPLWSLPSTLVFERPTITGLCDLLAREAFPALMPEEPRPIVVERRVQAPTSVEREPIAVIGLGCRFPGNAETPEAFWRLLVEGTDAVCEVPRDRWNIDAYFSPEADAPGKTYGRHGGFLRDVRGFDPEFFGIAPREAAGMDPQQRLMLEVGWEALENAGVPLERLSGSQTGVFVGILGSEYLEYRLRRGGPSQADAHAATGAVRSGAAGRLAYALGLEGPAITVDTACSSSLVAVHLACQSLRLRECDLALAGGVNVMLLPDGSILLSRMGALSRDGHCKTFDAAADGYVRGEGCGAVVLKRLSDALADGDDVLAVISGSAVNQDGASGGFTVPSGTSQQTLIRRALADAGVDPADVGYVEAHGTGTPLGDPIEARALGAVLSKGRAAEHPFVLGSVKTNLGHLEAAAGIAGLIKVVLSLRHGLIPPHLHFKQLNPRISSTDLPSVIPTSAMPWPSYGKRRIAGVSSFGLSGTNAHVIVEEPPTRAAAPAKHETPGRALLLPLSARSPEALRAAADAYLGFLAPGGAGAALSLRDIAFTASTRRTHHGHRLAIVGSAHDQVVDGLRAFLDGEARPGLSSAADAAEGRPRRIVFAFPGQGSQWPSMGRQLLREEPAFREAMERCDQAMRAHADWTLIDVLTRDDAAALLERIDVVQPVLFAMAVSLAALWASWGVRPDAVIGHSQGEIAASVVAGALRLEDGARIICQRSALLRRLTGKGGMAAVDLSFDEATALLRGYEDRLAIAASNGPRSTVLSGEPNALTEVLEKLTRDGVFCRRIKVDFASHSPQVDELRDDLVGALSGIQPCTASTPLYSTVTSHPIDGSALDATYWMRNLREPVLFSAAAEHAMKDGHDIFLEISPHPILVPALEQLLGGGDRRGLAVPSLRRGEDERAAMLSSLGALYAAGYAVEHGRLYPSGGRPCPLPSYPWQNETCWFEAVREDEGAALDASGPRRGRRHPILGDHTPSSSRPGLHIWETEIDASSLSYLKDHRIHGTVVVPGMTYVGMALAAAKELFGGEHHVLEAVEFQRAIFLPDDAPARIVQTTVEIDGKGGASFQIHSRSSAPRADEAENPWVLHMCARIGSGRELTAASVNAAEMATIEARCTHAIDRADFYRSLEALGNHFGPRHQGVSRLRRASGEALGHVVLPQLLEHEAAPYVIHPALLDACGQVGLAAVPGNDEGDAIGVTKAFMPRRVERIVMHGRPGTSLWSHARTVPSETDDAVTEDLRIFDDEGRVLIEISALRGNYLERDAETALPTDLEEWLYEVAWERKASTASKDTAPASGAWLVFADEGGLGDALAARLRSLGDAVVLVHAGERYERVDAHRFHVAFDAAADLLRVIDDVFEGEGLACRGVVHLSALDAATEPVTAAGMMTAQRRVCSPVITSVQAIVQRRWKSAPPRVWIVTRGAHRLEGDQGGLSLAQSTVWGLGRSLSAEHASLWGGLMDLCPATAAVEQAELLCDHLLAPDGEDQIAWRRGQRYVARLARCPRALGRTRPLRLRADGTYLITGGLGGLGLEVARWMIEQGARRLILMGRSALPPRATWASIEENHPKAQAIAAVRALESLGASVHLAAVDVSDEAALSAFFTSFRQEAWPPLRGVVHGAGVYHDVALAELDEATLEAELLPKVVGGYLLHTLLADAPLDFFVSFSSAAAVLGSPMLGAYAAANTFLDALAHHQRALGRSGLSINWGYWGETGGARQTEIARGRTVTPHGMGHFAPQPALEIMKMLMEREVAQSLVMVANWKVWSQFHASTAKLPLYQELCNASAAAGEHTSSAPSLPEELLALEPGFRRRNRLESYLLEQVGQVLRISPSKVGLHRPLGSLGLDSLIGIDLRNRLEKATGLSLPATLAWTYPTVAELSNHLATQMGIPLDPTASGEVAIAAPESGTVPTEPEDMSLESAEALLASTLAQIEQRRSHG